MWCVQETLALEFRDLDAMEAEDEDLDMSIHGNDLAGVSSQEFLVLSNEVETISNRMEVLEVEVTKVRGSIKKILKHLGRVSHKILIPPLHYVTVVMLSRLRTIAPCGYHVLIYLPY